MSKMRSEFRMSEFSKISMTEQFGFKNSELSEIENFMSQQNQKTAKEVLDNLLKDKKLSNKQKIIIAYFVGNSARESTIQEEIKKGIRIDMSGGVPPIGG